MWWHKRMGKVVFVNVSLSRKIPSLVVWGKTWTKQEKSDAAHHGKHTARCELSDVWTFIISFAYHVPAPDQ